MGQYNDDLYTFLGEELGREGALNDRLYSQYKDMGYEGALNDLAKTIRDSVSSTDTYPVIRNVRTFNGIDTSGAYAVPVAMGIGDTLKIPFAYPSGGVARNLNEYIQFDAGNLLQLTSCTATIDGTPIASGASMAAYIDGKLHEIEITATAAISVGYIGQNGAAGAFYAGQILDNIFTISGVTTPYIIDNDSTTTTYARGNAAPSTKYITWSTFTAAYIAQYTYNAPSRRWEGVERLADTVFNTACGVNWTCELGWAIGAGVASSTNADANKAVYQLNIAKSGQRYITVFEVLNYVSGLPKLGAAFNGTVRPANGVYTEILTAGANPNFTVQSSISAATYDADNVSCKHVLEYV